MPPHTAATLLDPPTLQPPAPRDTPGPRFEIRWDGPHWTEIDVLTGEILAEGTITAAGEELPF